MIHTSIFPMEFVLFVLNFSVNLLCINKIIEDLNYCVTFFSYSLCIWGSLDDEEDYGGYEVGGMYYLDVLSYTIRALSSQVSPFQWHLYLGHPSIEKLKKIVSVSSSMAPSFGSSTILGCFSFLELRNNVLHHLS